MKNKKLLALVVFAMAMSGCAVSDYIPNKNQNNGSQEPSQQQEEQEQHESDPSNHHEQDPTVNPGVNFTDKEVNFYSKPLVSAEKQITLRFFESSPSVPYIKVNTFFKEFYKKDLSLEKSGNYYKYSINEKYYLGFESNLNLLFAKGLVNFNSHPDFVSSTGKLFIKLDKYEESADQERVINLDNYHIDIFDDGENAYAPVSLLSKFAGGLSLVDIAYNGKDLFLIDNQGELGTEISQRDYGTTYSSELNNRSTPRTRDMADYVYNELCFVFDYMRGYTSQLLIGDNNLLSLGLDSALRQYAPKTREYLLSLNKLDYYEGLNSLFNALSDGGHTVIMGYPSLFSEGRARQSEEEFVDFLNRSSSANSYKLSASKSAFVSRSNKLGLNGGFGYYYDVATKTAFITFRDFSVDYIGWNDYYENGGPIPVETDTYAYVRFSLYRAKEAGAENLVLDLTTNGGGSSYALEGLIGLFNCGISVLNTNNTFNKQRCSEKHLIDINLDGKFDELDAEEANSLNFNVGVLTTRYSFSCANLFPSMMKELGYKIMGEQSGGGSCAIALDSTCDGIQFVHSSYICLSDLAGNNIDSGVPVDLEIEHHEMYPGAALENYDSFFDFNILGGYLSQAYL